jgi:hypothetical protein
VITGDREQSVSEIYAASVTKFGKPGLALRNPPELVRQIARENDHVRFRRHNRFPQGVRDLEATALDVDIREMRDTSSVSHCAFAFR